MVYPKPKQRTPIHGVAIDQGSGLGAAVAEARGADAREQDLFDFKRAVVECLSPAASMMLVDAEYGRRLLPFVDSSCDRLLAYEADVYRISGSERMTVLPDNLSVAEYRTLGVERLKFFLYYGPRCADATNEKKQTLVREIGAQCSEHGIEFLFEPLVYDDRITDPASLEFAELKPGLVQDATATFADPSFGVDVLKVEIPVNLAFVEGFGTGDFSRQWALEQFRRAADAAGSVPIVYLSAGVSFDWFEQSLRLARAAGVSAAGFMCGRAIWSDAVAEFGRGGEARLAEWLMDEGHRRLEALKSAL